MTEDIFFASISDLNASLKKREFSVVELVRAFAERLETIGPRYNALALPLKELAIRRAEEVEGDLKRERYRGPLQGIPFGVKDLLAFPGRPTTWGAKPYAGQVIDETATVLTKLDKTGSVLIGKLSMLSLAAAGGVRSAGASLAGPGLNPWDRTRWAGGSSTGSGIAVAAGLTPFALGSETSGSILTPSAFCGVTGLRPTYGLVSRYGAMAVAWTLDKIGPMCRSAEDCGIVLDAIAGKDSKDPSSAAKSFYYAPQYSRKFSDLKIGFAPADMEWAPPATRPVFQATLQVFRDIGLQMVESKLPDLPYGPLIWLIISTEGSSVFEPLIASGRVNLLNDSSQIAGLKAGLEIPARDYLRAMRVRSILKQKFAELFADVDVLIAPTRYNVAPKVTDSLDIPDMEPYNGPPGMTSLIQAGNLAGLPALSLPCGFAGNLPLGIQLCGPAFTENTLIAIGKEFQARTDWHKRRPPLVS